MVLHVDHVSVCYDDYVAVDDVTFTLNSGEWLVLVGPNGAGKTTLINAIAQGIAYTGTIYWDYQNIRSLSSKQLAQRIGYLSQKQSVNYAYTVEEIVSLGRYAYRSSFLSNNEEENQKFVEQALELTNLVKLRHTNIMSLSGGEQQRVFLAQVFAQNPQLLILDEPANHLDLKYQQHIFYLIRDWVKETKRAVLSVVHDLSLARYFGTNVLLMDHGSCVSQGRVENVLTSSNLQKVFEIDVYSWMQSMLSQWKTSI